MPLPFPANFVPYDPAQDRFHKPLSLGLRVLTAYVWSQQLLGTMGDNGDDRTMGLLGALGAKAEPVAPGQKDQIAVAFRDLMTRVLVHEGYTKGTVSRASFDRLGCNYGPDVMLAAIVATVVPKTPYMGFFPMKTHTSADEGTNCLYVAAGYDAEGVKYYPLDDGRVVVSHERGYFSPAVLAFLVARADAGDGVPGIGFMVDGAPDEPLFNWKTWNESLPPSPWADADARPNPQDPNAPGVYTYANGAVRELWLAEPGSWEGEPQLDPKIPYATTLDNTPGEHPVYGQYDAIQVHRTYNLDPSTVAPAEGAPSETP